MVATVAQFSSVLVPNFRFPNRAPRTLLARFPLPSKLCPFISMATSYQQAHDTCDDAGVKAASTDAVGEFDLLIVGPGVLGRMVAERWQQEHPGCHIYGQTMTADHHDELLGIGISPSLRGSKFSQKFPYIIFCAPPSRTADYPSDVRLAASNWNGEGSFVFTSSTAVYDCTDNGICDEDCPIVPLGRSPRTDVLLKAENEVLEAGGCVLRLAGLYKSDRGAHVYWLEKGTVDVHPDHKLNVIHYELSAPPRLQSPWTACNLKESVIMNELNLANATSANDVMTQDAASLAVAVLKKKLRGRVFLGCDNHPLSRQELMDAAMQSGKFTKKFGGFTGTADPLGKMMFNSKTRTEFDWEPKYPSFRQFFGLAD